MTEEIQRLVLFDIEGNGGDPTEILPLLTRENANHVYDIGVLSLIYIATTWNHPCVPAIMRRLVELGVDLGQDYQRAGTPLTWALLSSTGRQYIPLLLELGAQVDAIPNGWCTPLRFAIEHDLTREGRLFMDRGASVVRTRMPANTLPEWVATYVKAHKCCRHACVTVLGLGVRVKVHRDVFGLIARHVWSRRLDEEDEQRWIM